MLFLLPIFPNFHPSENHLQVFLKLFTKMPIPKPNNAGIKEKPNEIQSQEPLNTRNGIRRPKIPKRGGYAHFKSAFLPPKTSPAIKEVIGIII